MAGKVFVAFVQWADSKMTTIQLFAFHSCKS